MTLNATSLAAAVGASVKNVQFAPVAANVPRKIAVIATGDLDNAGQAANVPVRVTSAQDAGDRFGFGTMAHRLAEQVFTGSNGIETWLIVQPAPSSATTASGLITFNGPEEIKAGVTRLYISGIGVPISIGDQQTPVQIAASAVAAINAYKELPVTAALNGEDQPSIELSAKSAGPWGNAISLRLNILAGDVLPGGLSVTIEEMSGGAGLPDITEALDAMGTGDDANEMFFTAMVHGYGPDTATLDAISNYVGAGNECTGCYDKLVSRPFRSLCGDVTAGSTGLNAATALSALRKLDRANGLICVPGSSNHPAEIAAQAIGHMERINIDRAAQSYIGTSMTGIDPGAKAGRWTNSYDNRDTAVKNGISPTRVQNGTVTMQNVVSFYRPDNVPVYSNGYRSMRNISILQNILHNVRTNFEKEKWRGVSIVKDTVRVTSAVDRQKARDIDAVIDDLIALAKAFQTKAWLFDACFTIKKLKEPGAVSIRAGATGFDSVLSVILSGEGGILDTAVHFDTDIAALAA
ncbi:MAG: hypothetical protein GY874_02690 [Desulfobacteraceae bacterium]|nr:hypothetical protein [Desulfobacteraceae bacterium]